MPFLPRLLPTSDGQVFSEYLEGLLAEADFPSPRFKAGELVFAEGDVGEVAYFIRSGTIDVVSRGYDGNQRLLNRLGSGELFGEMALLEQRRRSASAVVREDTALFVISKEEILDLLPRIPEMSLWMLKLSSHRLRVLTRMVSQMEQAQEVNLKILAGQEEERRRIGRDIHDGVAQSLADCILRLQQVESHLDGDSEQVRSEVIDLQTEMRAGLGKIREAVHNLYPKDLSRVGLVAAIERFVERTAALAGLDTTFEHTGLELEFPAALEATLYCVVQEALNNVKKHARASKVRLGLTCENRLLTLCIADDGCGFIVRHAVDRKANNDHYGLFSMEERVRLAGGSMELESSPGTGTMLRFYFPVNTCG